MSRSPRANAICLAMIAEAAAAGAAAPSQESFFNACADARCATTIHTVLLDLQRRGLIEIERPTSNTRRFLHVESGMWTGVTEPRMRKDAVARGHRTLSAASPRSDRRAAAKKRKCLSCPEVIMSEGPHHRMCRRCASAAADASPIAQYGYGVSA